MKILFKPQSKHPHHHNIWTPVYFYISMEFPIYLPTEIFFVQTLFFWKKYAWRIPYLTTVWTYVLNFIGFFMELSPKRNICDPMSHFYEYYVHCSNQHLKTCGGLPVITQPPARLLLIEVSIPVVTYSVCSSKPS